MKRRRTDEGLVIVGLLLLAIGGYLLFGGEVHISRLTVEESRGVGGVVAQVIGAVFAALGAYFLWQSRR